MEQKPREKPVEKRESVRGRLEYYHELIRQNETGKECEAKIQDKTAAY